MIFISIDSAIMHHTPQPEYAFGAVVHVDFRCQARSPVDGGFLAIETAVDGWTAAAKTARLGIGVKATRELAAAIRGEVGG
jgi:hypothetical protein